MSNLLGSLPTPPDFPDWLFPISGGFRKAHTLRVAAGSKTASQAGVVICGLTRDSAQTISRTASRVMQLASQFKNAQILVYENDSADSTALALLGWQSLYPGNVRVVCETLDDPVNAPTRELARMERMAKYRNKLLTIIRQDYSSADYVIVIDLDLEAGWSVTGVLNTFGYAADWDFCGSNGIKFVPSPVPGLPDYPIQYDAWAWRWRGSRVPPSNDSINELVWANGRPLVSVGSCFGGLGIYKMSAYLAGCYDGSDCEHVTFHRRLRENGFGRLFMNPSQLVLYT